MRKVFQAFNGWTYKYNKEGKQSASYLNFKLLNTMEFQINLNELGYSDIKSYGLVLQAYADFVGANEAIMGTGFNTSSGYVYIALENGITIASCFGQEVEYIVNDPENGEEYFHDTFQEALERLAYINETY